MYQANEPIDLMLVHATPNGGDASVAIIKTDVDLSSGHVEYSELAGHPGAMVSPHACERKFMRKFIIEREIPAVGTFEREQLREAAKTSNAALAELGKDIQWVESYVAADKTFCVYLAADEDVIRRHAEISGFPANRITEVKRVIDPTTAS